MTRRPVDHHGATLVEALVAVALGTLVVGGAMVLYIQGNRAFGTTTEHASFREEALTVLETINRDLEELVVSDDRNPRTGRFYMVEPFELAAEDGSALRFHKYHHTQTIEKDGATLPQVVGQAIEYRTEPVDAAAPARGVNLLRNGRKVNRQPLALVRFERMDPIVALNNIGGCPNGLLEVTVLPRGGMWGQMSRETLERLRRENRSVNRIHHLVGYESQYTTVLWKALTKGQAGQPLSPLELAVSADADSRPAALAGPIRERLKQIADLDFALDPDTVRLDDVPYDEAGARRFPQFSKAPLKAGIQTSTGIDRSDFRQSGSTTSTIL